MQEVLIGISLVASLILAGYAVGCCWQEQSRSIFGKIFFTAFILILPVGGALVYFRIRDQESELISEMGNRRGRRGRRR